MGQTLHTELKEYDETLIPAHSYIHEAWSEMYLTDRSAVLINQTPGLTIQDDPDPSYNSQVSRATSLVGSILKYYITLRDEKLPPIKSCTLPLPYLFQTSRTPKKNEDILSRNADAKHIVVVRNGHYFSVDVLDKDGGIKSSNALRAAFEVITHDSRPVSTVGLGYFTALDRDSWTPCRAELDHTNPSVMKAIDDALFVVCLDDKIVSEDKDVMLNGLIGDPSNRWYDKCFELMISKNGKASIHWEHSWGDGSVIIQMINEVYNDAIKHQPIFSSDDKISVKHLDLNLTPQSVADLNAAKESVDKYISRMELIPYKFEGFGKADCKNFGVSPDSISQLIFQIAQWRNKNNAVSTYESCSTSAFRSGRTETIRSCSTNTKNCAIAFDKEHPASMDDLAKLLKLNSESHVSLCKNAAAGYGFDRHLFALKWLNDKKGRSSLPLFTHPNHTKLASIQLSTSTVVSPSLQLCLVFGPVSSNGLGLGMKIFCST